MKPWILLVFLVAAGCGESAGPECTSNADCEGGAICLDGKCQALACQGGCPDGTYCDETSDKCVPCNVDEHCGSQCRDCTLGTHDLCTGSCHDGACVYPEDACGACRACDGQGNCMDAPAGQDPFNDCEGLPPCGQVCDGDGGCMFPGPNVQCGLTCQHCDGAGSCVANCSHEECRQNLWECQCHPLDTALTCGSTAGGDLSNPEDTTDLFASYGGNCNWPGNPLDGREATYEFGFSGTPGIPNQRNVTVTVYAVCGVSEVIGIALAGDHPCDLDQCVPSQAVSGFS